jgi:low affinity Fe/Cu permease
MRRPWLERFAEAVVNRLAQPQAFLVSLGLVVCWAVAGPIFHFNQTWQLAVNTATTIITFLIGFLILLSGNLQEERAKQREEAMQVKLGELLRAIAGARTDLGNLEDRTGAEIQTAKDEVRDAKNNP